MGKVWRLSNIDVGGQLDVLVTIGFLVGQPYLGSFRIPWDPFECVLGLLCRENSTRDHFVERCLSREDWVFGKCFTH